MEGDGMVNASKKKILKNSIVKKAKNTALDQSFITTMTVLFINFKKSYSAKLLSPGAESNGWTSCQAFGVADGAYFFNFFASRLFLK